MTKRSSTKYYKEFYPTTRRPHWSRSENQRAFLFGLFFELVLVAFSREDNTFALALPFFFRRFTRWTLSMSISRQSLASMMTSFRFHFIPSLPLTLGNPFNMEIVFDWFSRYSDLSSCWARTEFKIIPLFCNAQFYSASFFQDGGLPHRIDRMGYFSERAKSRHFKFYAKIMG